MSCPDPLGLVLKKHQIAHDIRASIGDLRGKTILDIYSSGLSGSTKPYA